MHGAIGARSRYPTYARRASGTVSRVTFRRAAAVTFPGLPGPGHEKGGPEAASFAAWDRDQSARTTAGGAVLPMTETSAAATAEFGEPPEAAVMRRRSAP